jgi:hypothetical protein
VLTGETAEADVGSEPDDPPFVTAAGMRLAQADHIIETKFDDHGLTRLGQRAGRRAVPEPPDERQRRSRDRLTRR